MTIRVGAGYDLPRSIPDCQLYLHAGRGITLSTDYEGPYSDMSSWTKVNCTATATVLTDTLDGGSTAHYIRRSWNTLKAGERISRISVELKAGTLTQAMVADFGGGWSVVFNLANGTLVNSSNITQPTITDVGSGWWRVEFGTTAAGTVTISLQTAKNGSNYYVGDGTGTIQAQNWKIDIGIRVASWADQSGNGYDFAQSTANYQPLQLTYSGTPSLYFDPTYAVKHFTRAYTAAFNTAQATFVAFYQIPAYGGTARSVPVPLRTSSGVEAFDWWENGGTQYTARTSTGISTANTAPTTRTMSAMVISSGNAVKTYKERARTLLQNGTFGAASGTTSTGHFIGTRAELTTAFPGYLFCTLVYSRALTSDELRKLSSWGYSEFGIL